MGQYRQWLQYRDIDQQLHAQLALLEQQVSQIREQIAKLETDPSYTENPVIQKLLGAYHTEQVLARWEEINQIAQAEATKQASGSTPSVQQKKHHTEKPESETTLSNPTPQFVPPARPAQIYPIAPSVQELQSATYLQHQLFSVHTNASTEDHSPTDPQMKIPWWLRNIFNHMQDSQGMKPIDQQSIRDNRLIQRWFERWGQQTDNNAIQEDQLQ
ncbi:MAG TPA: hypothetical protein VL461_02585 [Dictyobacter sp.]|jgi:hypothetical protein|nr:hypothetical protein [Dictyobacter sp.]